METGFSKIEHRYYESLLAMHRIGQVSNEEIGFVAAQMNGPDAGFVGAAGAGFVNTKELTVMKYDEAMRTGDKEEWDKAVLAEKQKMDKYSVLKQVYIKDLPKHAKILTTTWAMKKKANGVFRARMNARGFEQQKGIHYDPDGLAAPVANEITIRIALTLMMMANWYAYMIDHVGAFLHGRFGAGEEIYISVPQGFEKFYPPGVVLQLERTLYGTKQAAAQYWKENLKCFKDMGYNRSKADPCLQYKWIDGRLILWLTWVDDLLNLGNKEDVLKEKEEMKERFECDDVGEAKEYIGCKLTRKGNSLKLTQPVLIQSFEDEFDLPKEKFETPAAPGSILVEEGEDKYVSKEEMQIYRRGVGKLLFLTRWSRPDIYNAVRECSRFGGRTTEQHMKQMKRTMKFCVCTKDRGLTFSPKNGWDGRNKHKFRIVGESDSDYAKDPITRRSVSGWNVKLDDSVVSFKSKMMPVVALSVTEAELFAATACVQDMLYVKKVVESMGLEVELPMVLKVDNQGARDLMNNWSVGGRTRHVEVKQYFIRDLKEAGWLVIEWIPTDEMTSDIFTKNLGGPLYGKHSNVLTSE